MWERGHTATAPLPRPSPVQTAARRGENDISLRFPQCRCGRRRPPPPSPLHPHRGRGGAVRRRSGGRRAWPGRPPGWWKPRSWTRQRPRAGAYRFQSSGFIRSGRAAAWLIPVPVTEPSAPATLSSLFWGGWVSHANPGGGRRDLRHSHRQSAARVQVKSPRLFGETFRRCCGDFSRQSLLLHTKDAASTTLPQSVLGEGGPVVPARVGAAVEPAFGAALIAPRWCSLTAVS